MTTLEQFRWHAVAVFSVTALAERIRAAVWRQKHRVHQAEEASHDDGYVLRSPSRPIPRPRPGRVALARLLDADCQSCHGFGCDMCAGTGLA